MSLRSFLQKHTRLYPAYRALCNLFAEVKWQRTQAVRNGGIYYSLIEEDHDKLRKLLKEDYYVILTHRKCHLTSYVIALISFFATGKLTYWTHTAMNVEGDINNHMDFRIIEATGKGVHFSTFMEVFDCDGVALLKPRGVPREQWSLAMEAAKAEIGLEYDLFFDINDASKVSCVEVFYQALKAIPAYQERFPNLLKMIAVKGELEPEMLLRSEDMDVVFMVKR